VYLLYQSVNTNKLEAIADIKHSFLAFFPYYPPLFSLVPTGIKDLMLYPLGPTAVVLSWTRPYLGVFRKYVVEMFYFNPVTMTSEWTTYYEIAATVSLTASVVIFPSPTVTLPTYTDMPVS
jgi:hypothetical protein